MSETLGEARKRLARDIEALPRLARVIMRRRLRKLNRKIDGERDRVLRRYRDS